MEGYQEWYETAEDRVYGLEEQHKAPVNLAMELFQKVEALEKRMDELHRSLEAEEWF